MDPDERVLKYTEHAMKFDVAKNLDLPGRHLSLVAFYNLDVWALLIVIFGISAFLLFRVAIFVVNFLLVRIGEGKKKAE